MPSIAQLERLLAIDPADPFVPYALGQEHAKQGRFDQAIAWYDRCLALDPSYCYAYYHKARALEPAGDRAAIEAVLRQGLAAAKAAGDAKASSELASFLESLR